MCAVVESPPTLENPDVGTVGYAGLCLSRTLMWHEDDEVVLRSTEYDVFASGDTLEKAVQAFVQSTIAYVALLEEHRAATDDDRQIVQMIYERLGQIFATIEMQEPHGLAPRMRARRRNRGWHLQHHAARI